ncbi:hypothetical protein CQY20_12915 [Mycolicibacterium agri]|uniref:REDY-like protein HapK n=1 Tax=Mycolicibacterium agri TaxID=36811 RepID=A0A2A7N412_MYCAG|nr:hypothetical protein [Mycolicibacterium agri]PEG38590.1 hypothetical protein CQY20_12915 [Mycolicibacterium agri]GFG53538.1 hypothetical protein MAGR_49790 [Mycolicibacterium agri]
MSPVTAINRFSLRPGVTAAQFERFSREVDRPVCLSFPEVKRFDVFIADADPSRVEVIELMTVASWPEWEAIRDGAPELAPIVQRFSELVDTSTVSTVFTRPLSPPEEK